MIKLSQKVGAELELPPILLRIGINAGPVVVGAIGNDLRVKFTAMGDTINLASRMETLAAPGTTYVTEETFKLTEGFFRFEAVAEEILIETEKPIKVFRVIAPSGRRTRFDVSAERGLTPLVGRERELELLADSFERAKAGNGQAVSIVSEAGMGKSRLLYEFRKSVTHEDVLFLEGKCLSYSKGVAYHPVIDILKSAFRIQEGDEDSAVRQRIVEGLEFLEIEESGIMPYLLELLSVKDSGLDRFTISLQSLKERLNEAVLQILIKGSEIRPLIVAIEDLHWADTSSIDLLHDLLSYVPGARILLIFTYRPQFVPAWSFKSYHCQISLNRLLRRESLSMVVHLLNTRTLDRKVETLILEKTEGVPFFVEEFVTSLLDLNIITKTEDTYRLAKNLAELSIPSTISDVIMARVDTLKEPAKELLQIGSIIEREFSHRLIERVAGFPEEDLQATLGVLKHSELLIERGVYPQSTYVFRHALTREDDKRAVDLESLYRYYEDNQVLFNAGLMPMYIGDILMDIDDQHLDEAEGWIQKAIDTDRQNGLTLHLGKHYALYAELQIRKGDRQVAKDHLGKAIDVFKECGAQGRVESLSRRFHDLL
ncbi:Adenylate cyclase (EC / Guanylate cyclase (EC [Olavius algarvensis associated proteobacterium Delta 3]|nr:Adenylate cyclase (EC / Guanylate cyclase (EC [Olavius algarvensis associated proteobacterium Delta 3]